MGGRFNDSTDAKQFLDVEEESALNQKLTVGRFFLIDGKTAIPSGNGLGIEIGFDAVEVFSISRRIVEGTTFFNTARSCSQPDSRMRRHLRYKPHAQSAHRPRSRMSNTGMGPTDE
jgi:hypothetical protein